MATESVLVQGAGAWGQALALVLARKNHHVLLWDTNQTLINTIKERGQLAGVSLPPNILPITTLAKAKSSLIINATPSYGLRASLEALQAVSQPVSVCIATKGFEVGSQKLPFQVAAECLPNAKVAILSGPSFAAEVVAELPTAVVIAAADSTIATTFSTLFDSSVFRVHTDTDVIGVALSGAVKNVMAIAAGIAEGLGYGANANAALVAFGLAEMTQLGLALGAQQKTFSGVAGLGDLVLTCSDNQSRNRRLGLLLAKGATLTAATAEIGEAVEGVKTAIEVGHLAKQHQLTLPITEQVIRVLQSECTPSEAVADLLKRAP